MKINKLERKSETESESLQDLVPKVITENSLSQRSKAKRLLINSARNGEQWTRKVSPIDSLVPRCPNIFTQEKQEKVQEIGDDFPLFCFKNDRLILFISF